jgi:hypothetical protein
LSFKNDWRKWKIMWYMGMMGLYKKGSNGTGAPWGIKEGMILDRTGHSLNHEVEHGSVVQSSWFVP